MWNCYAQGILKETRGNTKKFLYEEKSFTISYTAGINGIKIGVNIKNGYMPVSIQPVSLPRGSTTVYSFMINQSGEIWTMINSSYNEENVTIGLGFLWMKK